MAITVIGSVWYLELCASFHMMGNRYFFNDLEEKDLQINIKMEGDGIYNMTWIGTVTFQRELGSPRLKDVMFILGLKKNLVFVAALEDHGYDMIFNEGKNS